MWRRLPWAVLLVACVQQQEVVFDVHTDLVPGAGFDRVVVTAAGASYVTPATPVDYHDGVRLGGVRVPSGEARFRVGLRRGGTEILGRDLVFRVTGDAVVPVWLLAICRGRVCPEAGDPAGATECESGHCVVPECSELHPELCEVPECTVDAECMASLDACGELRCETGRCVFRANDGGCGPGTECDPTLGCVVPVLDPDAPVEPGIDTGPHLTDAPDSPARDVPAMDTPAAVDTPAAMDTPAADTPAVDTPADARDGEVGDSPMIDGTPGVCFYPGADCDGLAGCEVDLRDHVSCGLDCASRLDCTTLPGTTSGTCVSSTCTFGCEVGRSNCDGNAANGCETGPAVATSCGTISCGTTPVDCTALPNVSSATCMAGVCSITCETNYADCDGLVTTGCETNLRSVRSCGTTCATAIDCNALPNVMSATCGVGCTMLTCDAGYSNCDGSEANGCERMGACT